MHPKYAQSAQTVQLKQTYNFKGGSSAVSRSGCLLGGETSIGNGVYYTRQAHKYGHAVRHKCTQNALKVLKQCIEKKLTTSRAAAALLAGAAACLGGKQAKVGNGVDYTRQAHKHGHAVRPKCT